MPRPNPARRPQLRSRMSVREFQAWYWMKTELADFARELGLSAAGDKPALAERIERRLRGLPEVRQAPARRGGRRDSDAPLSRATPVVNYFSDDATRAFFRDRIGPEFHFTYRLNQFRLARTGLTYGDLIDEWQRERDRRRDPNYQAPLAAHGKWNLFVRAFFADAANAGSTMADAALAWNRVKAQRGPAVYRASRRPGRKA